MMAAPSERSFMTTIGRLLPGAGGYRDQASRPGTDALLREHVAGELARLRARIDELRTAAQDEGEEDMVDDLERIDGRMERTIEAVRAADYAGLPFFTMERLPEADLERACACDQALLEDLALLSTDVMGLRYETIGSLTLREAEGTLAAIELKAANRRDLFENAGNMETE